MQSVEWNGERERCELLRTKLSYPLSHAIESKSLCCFNNHTLNVKKWTRPSQYGVYWFHELCLFYTNEFWKYETCPYIPLNLPRKMPFTRSSICVWYKCSWSRIISTSRLAKYVLRDPFGFRDEQLLALKEGKMGVWNAVIAELARLALQFASQLSTNH